MKIQPSNKHLLIRIVDLTHSDAGIVLPDGVRPNPYGEVIAIGPDVKEFYVGDKVLFLPNGIIGFNQTDDNGKQEEVYIINEGIVLGKYVGETLSIVS